MPGIPIDSLTKEYGSVRAVDSIDLTVKDGEFLVLVGPSGCGKSTTLRCIAGLETVTSGTINIGDRDVTSVPAAERGLSLLFQDLALYPHMTVEENMRYALEIADFSEDEIEKRVREAAEMLQIDSHLDRHPEQLSGGQQQRVAIGREIVREPDAFLMDEPLSDLDAKLQVEMRGQFDKIQNEMGITTVYVTHNQESAMTLGDRIAVMNEGTIQQVDAPERIYHKPINKFVAGFIGSPQMNFFEGSMRASGTGQCDVETDEVSFTIDDASITGSERNTIVGVRPQKMELQAQQTGDRPTVSGTITAIEPMGEQANVHVETSEREINVVEGNYTNYDVGDSVVATFSDADVHMFDTDTGKRLSLDKEPVTA